MKQCWLKMGLLDEFNLGDILISGQRVRGQSPLLLQNVLGGILDPLFQGNAAITISVNLFYIKHCNVPAMFSLFS